MSENAHETDVAPTDDEAAYHAPVVEDLETPDGPAVTAAGLQSKPT
jgi:hypothetical protein